MENLNLVEITKMLPSDENIRKSSDIFKALSDFTRLKIICALKIRELRVQDLCEIINISQSAISHQLSTLKKLSLVKYRRFGKCTYYSLEDQHVDNIISICLEHLNHI